MFDFLCDDHGLAREREEASLLLFIHRGTKPSRARGATDRRGEEPSLYCTRTITMSARSSTRRRDRSTTATPPPTAELFRPRHRATDADFFLPFVLFLFWSLDQSKADGDGSGLVVSERWTAVELPPRLHPVSPKFDAFLSSPELPNTANERALQTCHDSESNHPKKFHLPCPRTCPV
jgi:hypothetical protein